MSKLPILCLSLLLSGASIAAAYSGHIVKNMAVAGLQNGMDYVHLGSSDLLVSKVCMGTMTFGEQNTLEEGVEQLNLAFDEYGVNFLDTAEMYPVPTKAKTQGKTDETVAAFLKSRRREDIVLATKVAGTSERMTWLPRKNPEEGSKLTKDQILYSVKESLKRLGTDYIDLIQLHWPDRYTGGLFGAPDFSPTQLSEKQMIPFEEQLEAIQKLVEDGTVRYWGVSNETPFGVCSFAELAKQKPDKYPNLVSVQNSYSLAVRKDFEAGLAEACYHHKIGLLPYSPLAGGSLSGKYRDKKNVPKSCRYKLFPGFMERYYDSRNEAAVNAYAKIAEGNGMSPTEMALSWCYHREHVASTIIGATTIHQLKENIGAYDIILQEDVLEKIDGVYKEYTDPTKR